MKDNWPDSITGSKASESSQQREPKFSFVMIVLNGIPFIEYSLKSVYDFAHEIIIVEGAVEACMFAANPDGSSKDGTVEFIKSFPDIENKIKLIQGRWPEKCEMQNEALKYVTGNYVWLIDSDEVYKREDLEKIKDILKDDPLISQVNFIPDSFWKGLDYIFVSPKFFEPSNHYRRLFKYVPGATFITHRPPTLVWPGSQKTAEQIHLVDGFQTRQMGVVIYHYSYVTDKQVAQKMEYYGRRGPREIFGISRDQWYRECYLRWTPQNKQEIEAKYPVWMGDKNSYTQPFKGTHPEVMSSFIAGLETRISPRSERSQVCRSLSTPKKKHALVSYVAAPLRMGSDYNPYMFSNPGIARSIVRVLVEMGYIVDLIDWNCMDFKSDKTYELFLGHAGANWEYLSRNIVRDATKIYFSTSLYWKEFNRREAERFERFEERHGVRLPYDRWIKFSEEFAVHDADGIICLGNQVAAESYAHFPLCVCINNGVYHDDQYDPKKKNFDAGRRHFLYFGSSGNIHKGLDLLVEAFMELDAELWCGGYVDSGFVDVYKEELAKHPNIHLLGWVNLRSPLFYNLVNLCNCTIFASCAEGSTGGVIECMNQGLIPIVSRGATIDVECFGIALQDDSIEEIVRVVREVMAKPPQWHYEHSIETRKVVLSDYSEQAFRRNMRLGIEQVLSKSQQVRAERERIASQATDNFGAYYNTYRNDLGALLRGANRLRSQQRNDEAAQLWQQAMVVEPSCITPICELAAYYLDRGQFQKARDIARRAVKRCPLDKQALAILWQAEEALSRYVALGSFDASETKLADAGKVNFEADNVCDGRIQRSSRNRRAIRRQMRENIGNILWVRTDSIGDNVLSASMLPHIREKYKNAKITVVCQDHIAELYRSCPFVDGVIAFNKKRAYKDEAYLNNIVKRLQASKPDLSLNSVFSREPLTDVLAIKCRAAQRIAFEGNLCNISAEVRQKHNQFYTQLLLNNGGHKIELKRHEDFLRGLDINAPGLQPVVWITPEDEKFADRLFRETNLNPDKTIALFAGAQNDSRLYEKYGTAISEFCKKNQLKIIALGAELDHNINQRNLDATGVETINLSGKTTILQSAAILKRCKVAVGAETGLAHICCAVGTPNVIMLGGGHFGRFMPYSPLTSIVCLPLDCFGCNWHCRYERTHCIRDIAPEVIDGALRQSFARRSEKPRVFVQAASIWKQTANGPKWKLFDKFLDADKVEIITVDEVLKSDKRLCSPAVRKSNNLTTAARTANDDYPKISIITPSFNQGQFLEECIDSILSQNYPNLEYIIMDGGSTDGSVEIIKKYEKYLTYWQSEPDGGQYAAIDQGFKRTSGEIMAWLNSDDKYHPNSLFNVAHIFGKYPDVEWLTGRPTSWDENGQLINVGWLPSWCRENFTRPGPKGCYIQQESTFWKRMLWEKAGAKLRTDLKFAGDLELWLRFFRHTRLYTVDALLGGFRYHPNQKTKLCMDKYNQEAELLINQEITYIKQTGSAYMPPAPEPISNGEDFKLTIATTISPKNIERQSRAIDSWMKLGFKVVSINCAEEIELLQPSFPDIKFIQAKRDAREIFGKPVIYLDDFLEYFKKDDSEVCGIVNSDIFLFGDKGIISFIKEHAKDSLVYGSRMDVNSLEVLEGDVYEDGFDFFFFDKSLISCFPKSDFCVGMPWWDYWMPLIPALEKIQLKKLVSGFAYHLKHLRKWDKEHYNLLAKRFFGYLHGRVDGDFYSTTDSNPAILLAEMLLAYRRQDIIEKDRKEGEELSIGIISSCIIDFLKLRSSEIYYSGDELADEQNALVLSQKNKDIFVHKTKPEIQGADSLRAKYEVSIVLCTKDRAELLDRMLASLKEAARNVTCEVIVVEGGSSDNTLDVLRKHNIRKVYSESEWLGPGRHSWPKLYNFGFSEANGKWAMYASDDIVFSKGCISEAISLLNRQSSDVAGGVFFYKNVYPTNPEWSKYGIDFTSGQKLLMNYGLVRLDCFRKVGGLDEAYKFYCADSDFCYKLYEAGLQLIPLPSSFVAHDNVLDAQKKANYAASDRDIKLMQQRWRHFVPIEIPDPRRLTWQEDLFEAFNLPSNLGKVNSGIESFWHGLAYFQHGLFKKAKSKFIQAIESHCDYWHVHWLLANTSYQCGDKALAEKMVLQVLKLAPSFEQAKDFLNQLSAEARKSAEPVQCRIESENRLSPEGVNTKKDIVGLIFSKDRAMQLQAALESFFLHCSDNRRIKLHVLYKASSNLHQHQYSNLKETFSDVSFIEEIDFKKQVLSVVRKSEYVLFLVDDNLFVKDFSLTYVVKNLRENQDAIGFSLRLGRNTDYCYSHDSKQSLPVFQSIDNEILKYNWTAGEYDFGYPLELSSSLYRTRDILVLLDKLEFTNPNVLEDMMAANSQLYAQARDCLLCYENSVAFCNPINKVQSVWNNRSCADDRYSAERLAEMFNEGAGIDVEKFSGFVPNSCHQEVQVYFKAEGTGQSPERERGLIQPKFSIIMTNYNKEKYIAEAIESVLNQTFTDWELLIVEDCSTDNSPNVIKRYLNDTRIKLIQHKENRGKMAALRAAIADVRSEYFGILDSDDCLLPHAVETMYAEHVEFADCGLIYSQFTHCHQDLTQRCAGFCDKIPAGRTALDLNVVSHFQTFKLCDYLKTSGYDENILYAEDIDIVYQMEEVAGLKFVDECLYLYRELPDSICHSKSKINVAIMSRVKARINALKRRCDALAKSNGENFDDLFAQAVKQARAVHKDVEQYFAVLAELYENNMLLPDSSLPADVKGRDTEDRLLWLAANVNIKFDELFELLAGQGQTEKQPLVTVYIVTYNSEKFITRAIDSVLSQVYKNFELLIVDDGSTDKTRELVVSYSDSRIRYIYKEHKNCASGVNRVIAEAKGKYIMVVDSDDFIAPDYIKKMAAFAEKHPQVDYFYPAQLTLVDESGNPTGQQWDYMDFSDNTVLPSFLFRNCYGPIPNPGSLKRKTLFDKVGLYDEVDTVEDFVFLCKNALKINFKRVDEHSTYFYRRHQQSTSLKFEARNRIMADVLNEMTSIYPAEVLYPQIADISDADLKEQQYYKYLVETFCRHANGPMVQFGQYFQKYAVYYKSKLLSITAPAAVLQAPASHDASRGRGRQQDAGVPK